MTRDLALLPKAHLHLHFEAAMRPATLRDLAAEAGEPVPSWSAFEDFQDFEAAYGDVLALIRTPAHLGRIMDELADDAAADGARYVEVTLAPVLHAHLFDGDAEASLAHLLGLAAAAEERTGVVIRADDRQRSHVPGRAGGRRRAPRRGLGGPRRRLVRPARRRARVPGRVLRARVRRRARGGPADHAARGRAGGRRVRAGGPSRCCGRTGCCTACARSRTPSWSRAWSSWAPASTCAPPATWCCTWCRTWSTTRCRRCSPQASRARSTPDDPLQFGPGLLQEYELCRERLGLDDAALASCARASFTASGAPETVKTRALADIAAWLV